MGVPGAQGARAGGLVGPQGENAWEMGGSPPDRVDQLFGFCTPFRPPVYNTPGVRGNGNTTLVGKGRHVLDRGGLLTLLLTGDKTQEGHGTTGVFRCKCRDTAPSK